MTITASATAVGGEYSFTVTGNGGGFQEQQTYSVYVDNYTLSASPASVSMSLDNSSTSTITAAMNTGPNEAVPSLTASGMPSGVTVSFTRMTSPPAPSGTSTMTITVGSGTAPGTYPITVTGTAVGYLVAPTTTVMLTVPPWDTGTVTLTVTNTITNKVALSASTSYGQGSTPNSVAEGLAGSNANVSVTAINDTLYIEAAGTGGVNTDYSYTVTSAWNSVFTNPSFQGSPASGTLAGGDSASSSSTPVYCYGPPGSTFNSTACTLSNNSMYDGVGNVTGYTDSVMGAWSFTYDPLNRLATAAVTPPSGQTNPYPNYCWSYDSFGDRTAQMSASGSFASGQGGANGCSPSGNLGEYVWAQYNGTVNGSGNNQMSATSQNANQGQYYDASGDVMYDGVNQYLYDGEGRICAEASTPVPGFTTLTGYVYDAEGNRVAKGTLTQFTCDFNSADSTYNGFMTTNNETDYVLGPGGEEVTELAQDANGSMNWQRTYVQAAGALIATYAPSPDSPNQPLPSFRLTDGLGTMRVTTDASGVAQGTCTGLPFGDGVTCTNSPDPRYFTGKERDAESGNDYFGARYYASSMGRFLSPDPSGLYYADPTNPRSLNLYAYVLNNPLKFVDPTGLDCAYLNDAGDGIESLDQQSNSDECTQNGGYWADGAITNFQVNDNGSYTFTSLDANLNTLYTNFSGSSNTNSFVNLDVASYFANYQIQQRQLQSQSLLNMPQNQRIQQLAAGITKDTNCAVNSLMKGGSTAALDAAGMVPFGGDAEMAAPVAINAVSSVNSAVQGDATGSGLSTVNMVQGAVVSAVTSPSMGMNAPKAIPVAGQAYSAGLVARDVWNASGEYANCF